jgi:SAM-dependent methyltransferase
MRCPICEREYRRFRDQHGRRDALCPNPACMTVERHRLLWLLLTGELGLGRRPARVLHVAPEPGLIRRLRPLPGVDYTGVDMESPFADIHADLCELPFSDDSYDLVICSHVLEHVPRDGAALAEIRRVLAPEGTAILMYPIDHRRQTTDEDPTVTDPVERKRRFGQFDHVRMYGRDHLARLTSAGFDVSVRDVAVELDPADARRHGLAQLVGRPGAQADGNTIFLCR